VAYRMGVFFYQITLKGTKDFVLKCLFLCYIDLNHTPGLILLVLVEIIALTFSINSFTVTSNAKPLIAFCGLTVYSGCLLSPLNH